MSKQKFYISTNNTMAQLYLDKHDSNYESLLLAAQGFTHDVLLVTGRELEIVSDPGEVCQDNVIVAGTLRENNLINAAVESGQLSVAALAGKRECYVIQLVENLTIGGKIFPRVLVVAGSDKRGGMYGLFHMSGKMGVSPWVWFADVVPEKKRQVIVEKDEIEIISKEPSVRFRGIFINDESPSFTRWAKKRYGGLNEKMYKNVFELIIRLKGNYLWPAMWDNNFSEDGSEDVHANIQLADRYGIIMGTSHHEPMCRAGVEWQRIYRDYCDNNDWDYNTNREAISAFWRDGIRRNKAYENVITIGMRGENDSSLDGSLSYNVRLLKDIILTQEKILKQERLEDTPTLFVVYKEVEQYWNGGFDPLTGEMVEGLKHWKKDDGTSPLDDSIIMLCEDNYGNVRSLPVHPGGNASGKHKGGWGMYYHFDYNGAPRGYMWLNVMQLEKTWEQLSETYDYGVRDCWIVNVGDIKPMEMQISYYMDLAYDFETYGSNPKVTPGEYYRQFVQKQFSYGIGEVTGEAIARVLADYCKLNQMCKPEYARENVYSIENEGEAERILLWCRRIRKKADECRKLIPPELDDAYYQLVYYPAVASANVQELYIHLAYNKKYAAMGHKEANIYARLFENCVAYDKELSHYYHTMASGKWDGMMLQPHYGYTNWHYKSIKWPQASYVGRPVPELPAGTWLETGNRVSITAEGFVISVPHRTEAGKTEWKVIPHYGRYNAALKVFPATASYSREGNAFENGSSKEFTSPYVEYLFYVIEGGDYTLRIYTSPSNNLDGDLVKLRYAVQYDDEQPQMINSLPDGFIAGDYFEENWCQGVRWNIRITESPVPLQAGLHRMRFYAVDPGLVLQKLVVYRGKLPESYLGPGESPVVEGRDCTRMKQGPGKSAG
jgi:hypothetical protein